MRRLVGVALAGALLALSGAGVQPAAAAITVDALTLSVKRVDYPALALRGLVLRLDVATSQLDLRVASLRVGPHTLQDVHFACPRAALSYPVVECRGGRMRLARKPLPVSIDFRFDLAGRGARFVAAGDRGARVDARFDPSGRLEARLSRVPIAELVRQFQGMLPGLAGWNPSGVLEAELDWRGAPSMEDQATGGARREWLRLRAGIDNGAFGSADGQRAAERLAVDLSVEASAVEDRWQWVARADWKQGAAYLHPFFVEAGPRIQASGRLRGDRLTVREASVALEGVGALAASGNFDLQQRQWTDGALSVADADLAVIGPRWLAPLVAPAAAERLRFAGRVSAGLRFEAGALRELDAVLDGAGFSQPGPAGGGVSFGPVSGHVPWRANGVTRLQLEIGGARWERLAFGPFALAARLQGDRIGFDRSVIPLLDGAVVLDGLALQRVEGEWIGRGGAVIEPVSMHLLTAAAGLPAMEGVLSASIPALSVRPGEIAFDGALVISVFDGYLQATKLRVHEPFGVASHLTGDIEARHLDLAQLTRTFSFGSITGFADADIRGLELVRWRPARFDARVASSPGRYPRRISQRAVQNISALGGGGAMAAIQRRLIGLFDTFGYRDIGFRCVLDAGVCKADGISGVERADGGFVIVRGGGVPALDVIGYNRRIDWMELVDRLQSAIGSKAKAEVH